MWLKDKTVVILGGSTGSGLATAQAALAEGAKLIITGRSRERLVAARVKLQADVRTVALDVTDEPGTRALFASFDKVDHVFITAGMVTFDPKLAPASDALLSAQASLSRYMLVNLAGQLGLDAASFGSCVSERRYQDAIRADMAAGAKAGASGTPTFFVNGHPLRGAPSYAEFAATIERALKPGSKPTRIKTIDSV